MENARKADTEVTGNDSQEDARPKRVLYVDHTAMLGGGELSLLDIVSNLDRKRFVPLVVLGEDGPLARRLEEFKVETLLLPLDSSVKNMRKDSLQWAALLRFKDYFRIISYAKKLVQIIRSRKIDIVHTNSLKADITGGLAAKLTNTPLIWHIRDRIAKDYLPGPAVKIFRLLCQLMPDFIVANSKSTLATLGRMRKGRFKIIYAGVTVSSKSDVLYEGVSLRNPPTPKASQAIKSPLVGLVGRVSPWKGQHIFLKAAAKVHQHYPDVRFQIIGAALFDEHSYLASVRALCTELDMDECVEFTGFRDDIEVQVSNLDIFVHASTIPEPFGRVVLEGMASGKPIIATSGGGIPELVIDQVTGILIPLSDPDSMADAMADAICSLISDPSRACRMGELAQQRARDCFPLSRTIIQLEEIYDVLLSQTSK
jgi:glycosyltransferase involved in cell wall biosynthesis